MTPLGVPKFHKGKSNMRQFLLPLVFCGLLTAITPETTIAPKADGCIAPQSRMRLFQRIRARRHARRHGCWTPAPPAPSPVQGDYGSFWPSDVLAKHGFTKQSLATLDERKAVAEAYRKADLNLDYSTCERCGRPWCLCQSHETEYWRASNAELKSDIAVAAMGMFPLCEDCWKELSPQERLPFYRSLFDSWRGNILEQNLPYHKWELIEAAVLKGK